MEAAEHAAARSTDVPWNPPTLPRGDEVERSLELLDRVLSEFDDLENGNVGLEDDGYMSMNGRRQLKQEFPPPPAEEAQRIISTLLPRVSPSNSSKRTNGRRGRIHTSLTLGHESRLERNPITTIATQTTIPKTRHQRPFGWQNGGNSYHCGPSDGSEWRLPPRTVASVAGERHREVRRQEDATVPQQLAAVVESADANFSDDSLEDVPPPPPPPAQAPTKRSSIAWEVPLDDDEALYTPGSTKVIGRRRRRSTDRSSSGSMGRLRDADEWPDPPTGTEDGSISPLSDSSHLDSSTASKHDEFLAELSGTDMSTGGTYVIRKGRRKERKPMPLPPEALQNENQNQQPPSLSSPGQNGDLKRASTTFDNIKSLLREGLIDGLDEAPPDFAPPNPPAIVRVVSLPSIPADEENGRKTPESDIPNEHDGDSRQETPIKREIGIQASVEDLDSLPSLPNGIAETDSDSEGRKRSIVMVNGTTDTSSNEALMAELKKEYDTDSIRSSNNNEEIDEDEKPTIEVANERELEDPWLTAAEISEVQVIPVIEEKPPEEEKPPKEFKVMVEVVQHEFGPLPPSPVEEDDEYSDVLRPSPAQTPRGKTQGSEMREPFYRCLEPPGSDPLGTKFLNKSNPESHHRDGTSSLKTRSMDAGFTRNHRALNSSSSRRGEQVPSERRTLPTELQGPSRRRTLQKRGNSREDSASVGGTTNGSHMQVSCSLPETPIFARGCDIPRTPHRRAPDVPVSRTTPRQMSSATYSSRSAGMSLNEAMTGAELLRLAGGPARGWYPRHRQARPASVEHLDRLHQGLSPGSHGPPPGPWDPSRKPQTLPPNLTPKFFHRSPREALRRVTSLLIRRGNSKDKKDALSPTSGFTAYFVVGENGEGSRQKKGFFRSFWKRSRHYSLEQQ